MPWYLYILCSEIKETYYIGVSREPDRRLHFHNNDEKKGYTRRYRPWKIVYRKAYPTESEALAAERKVKGWKSKRMIRMLGRLI